MVTKKRKQNEKRKIKKKRREGQKTLCEKHKGTVAKQKVNDGEASGGVDSAAASGFLGQRNWALIESFVTLVMKTRELDGCREHNNGEGQ